MQDLMASYTHSPSRLMRAGVDIVWVGLRLRFQHAVRSRTRLKGGRGSPPLDTLVQDARHSFRSWRHDVGLAAMATLVVALGVGASSTVFSVANALLLRPLPFDDPGSLV
jgi:hypothetical protein